jgi:PKD repeat protein
MNWTKNVFIAVAALLLPSASQAQQFHPLQLQNGPVQLPILENQRVAAADIEIVQNRYYRLLLFQQMPAHAELEQLKQLDINLLEYLPHRTYLASLPAALDLAALARLQLQAVQAIPASFKLRAGLEQPPLPEWSAYRGKVQLMLKYWQDLDHQEVLRLCREAGIEVLRHNDGHNNFLRIAIPQTRITETAALPWVAFLDFVPAPDVPDDIIGRSLHRANMLDASYDGGRKYTGEGVNILVRDDGFVGPHIDFQGRIDNSLIEPQAGSHGDGVGGIMAGSGNLDPRNRGMAAGAHLFALNYEADFLDETMDLHLQQEVLVTNSSYSNGCNTGYTASAETVDQQLFLNPTLMHVFSAGNSNNNNCGYGAGNQWGNITGGHKQAKNCITTANLSGTGTLESSSSRGPAYDGRIKPDIAAHGQGQISTDENHSYQSFGGTSAASPGIAGIMAQLHQAYRELNNGEVAEAALLKTCLLNTANDLGNPGPDFRFGWGHVNALRAVNTLEEQRYFKATVEAGLTNSHQILIPAGVKQAKIMVYWSDLPAAVMASKALVNDLDCRVSFPGAPLPFLPWLLNPSPNTNTLNAPAGKGVDTLNNMEQIAIDFPVPGSYELQVEGKLVPFGNHSYWVTWEFRTDSITVTHPAGGEAFDPGETLRIHWDAYDNAGSFDISLVEATTGAVTPIATATPATRMQDWTIPADLVGFYKIRIARADQISESPDFFHIAPRPTNVTVQQACPQYLRVAWEPADVNLPGSDLQYEVLLLGSKYMEPVDTVSAPEAFVPTFGGNPHLDHWIAVHTLLNGGLHSERTVAILYNGGLLNCPQQFDATLVSILAPASGIATNCEGSDLQVSLELKNNGLDTLYDLPLSYILDQQPPVSGTIPLLLPGQSLIYTFDEPLMNLQAGPHAIQAFVNLPTDQFQFNDSLQQDFNLNIATATVTPDYLEDFDGGDFPPAHYFLLNPDSLSTWERVTRIGSTGANSSVLFVDNYSYNGNGAEDMIQTIPVDLSAATAPALSFNVAYAYYDNTYFDGLRVEVGRECGWENGEVIYEKFKDQLATAGTQGSFFNPASASQWRKEFIDLSQYVGEKIVLRFTNINGYGNSLYLDNIRVFEVMPPVAEILSSLDSVCDNKQVVFSVSSAADIDSYSWNFGPGALPPSSTSAGPVTVTFTQPGMQLVNLTVTNAAGSGSSSKQLEVLPLAEPEFTYVISSDSVVAFANSSQNATSYNWDFGDGSNSAEENPVHIYQQTGLYKVKLIAENSCGPRVTQEDINIQLTSLEEAQGGTAVWVQPNPSNGNFNLMLHLEAADELRLSLSDLSGREIRAMEVNVPRGVLSVPFHLEDLPGGTYLLRVMGSGGSQTLKVQVSR